MRQLVVKRKKPPPAGDGFESAWCAVGLGLNDLASLDGLGGYPHALHLAARELNTDVLKIRAECALDALGHVCANAAALLSKTGAVNTTALDGALACYGTNSGHGLPNG